jgi:hypothetical protein
MTKILEFIAAHMGFLWRGARFRIVGSEVSTSFGTNALLLVEGERIRLRFISDRDELSLDFQSVRANPSKNREWHSVDRIRRLMTGRREESGLLDESYARFVEEHLGQIEDLFSPEKWPETKERLKALGKVISKELFG